MKLLTNESVCVCVLRPWHTLSSWRSLRMPGRFVLRLSLKGFTGEFDSVRLRYRLMWCSHTSVTYCICDFSDDHVKFFCFQVLEHQIKFRWGWWWWCCVSSPLMKNNHVMSWAVCCCLCCRHAGLSAVQQQLIRETLMKWLQCQVPLLLLHFTWGLRSSLYFYSSTVQRRLVI